MGEHQRGKMLPRRKTRARGPDLLAFVLPGAILLLWILASEMKWMPGYLLPRPMDILRYGYDFFTGSLKLSPYAGTFFGHFSASLLRVLLGFFLGGAAGLLLGFCTGMFTKAKRLLEPMIHALRAVPGIGWLPLAMVWFGVGQKTTLFLIALAAFFPIYINVSLGVITVPPVLIRGGMMLGANKGNLIWHVILPSAFPSILVGLRLGLGIAWAYLVLGELTGVSEGLGAVMMDARMLGQTEMIFVTMILIALLGKICDVLLLGVSGVFYPRERMKART